MAAIDILNTLPCEQPKPIYTAEGHGWALHRSQVPAADSLVSMLWQLHAWVLHSKDPTPLFAASRRLLLRMEANNDQISALVFTLALFLRAKAYMPPEVVDHMQQRLALSDLDVSLITFELTHQAYELLAWALYWTELFYVHTLC